MRPWIRGWYKARPTNATGDSLRDPFIIWVFAGIQTYEQQLGRIKFVAYHELQIGVDKWKVHVWVN